jgi:GDP-L-fucose synthase
VQAVSRIYVAGHTGLVGSAILRELERLGYRNIVVRTSRELDLRDQLAVRAFFRAERPEYVFLAAATVGGILANSERGAEFIYDNLMIAANAIHEACLAGVRKLLNLGSSCIYPRLAPQPIKEEYLLTGPLEPTNEPYAVAKIAAIKLCASYNRQYGTDFLSVMPANLYGPHDNFDIESSHVLPALIRKMTEARETGGEVTLWGDGSPRREFLHVDDLAAAAIFLMQRHDVRDIGELVNIGTGEDISIRELAEKVAAAVGCAARIRWDISRPNGTPRKLLDVSRLRALGWQASISLDEGLRRTCEWFRDNRATARGAGRAAT